MTLKLFPGLTTTWLRMIKKQQRCTETFCKVACSKIKNNNYKLPYVLGSLLVPLKDRS